MKGKLILPILLMLVVFVVTRWPSLLPKEFASFSAVYAFAFCAGVYFPKAMAWWLPMGMIILSDLLLNVFFYGVSAFHSSMIGNYLSFLLVIFIGRKFSSKTSWIGLVGGGILGALLFYIISNTAAWLELNYPKTLLGWIQALTTGLPGYPPVWEFFRNTLLSGGLFAGLFAGAMKLSESSKEAEEPEEEEEGEPVSKPEESKA